MTKKSRKLPSLNVSREEAANKILKQIEKGKQLGDFSIYGQEDLRKAESEKTKWSNYNYDLLLTLFSDDSIAEEYNYVGPFMIMGDYTFQDEVKDFRKDANEKVERLESILHRLELYTEAIQVDYESDIPQNPVTSNRKIFIVHGQDNETKLTVTRFLEKLDFEPVILHEQANQGRTIIEKFEANSDVSFAIVLLTPDDIGYKKEQPEEAKSRARQNVIFELGFFMGRLGRNKVCALIKGDLEILSDIQGVVYTTMAGSWEIELARELSQAGLEVDFNKLFK
ncbi:putative nucleotide-binding protein with TIR-like domain [Aneurinibacillus soli]|uniref:Putative nucleotide-binding protein containing TIR-like domain protein n=1 Tax=Aneurinibacillus soli TaxID=1500254 RepID=A0A0U5AWW8_9BACL|nr:nucleotide-binding protein [Aneurinibacillus soli]PYE64276.1 putative nucleotide-binding protein with TIR-like domain [Aneurinibacillus soli]BAU28225.1 putative nucleotide-binding protein containing TIR-like domain protein [Aneurinibacillus soli]